MMFSPFLGLHGVFGCHLSQARSGRYSAIWASCSGSTSSDGGHRLTSAVPRTPRARRRRRHGHWPRVPGHD